MTSVTTELRNEWECIKKLLTKNQMEIDDKDSTIQDLTLQNEALRLKVAELGKQLQDTQTKVKNQAEEINRLKEETQSWDKDVVEEVVHEMKDMNGQSSSTQSK